ncbi:hypothetical protein D3H55_01685 [Bacillus salacetis]|uniref:Peptidase M14 domain-containing protein n=1 Tax=Bacillus salacetis TaxID=2315464 RepID=A0A3A1R791_9BACI|nr:M14 family metallocarboxypeptidase [Bacillus salacetis]RIW39088.1 hypothetical protein D3H55_01685 [Bacillus salacetis]
MKDFGNWHQINFGKYYGYVAKSGTRPADGDALQNLTQEFPVTNKHFKANKNAVVYDYSKNKPEAFAVIEEGESFPIVNYTENGYKVLVADRVGYINEEDFTLNFEFSSQQFEVTQEELPVYDNRSGSLELVGHLSKGQIFPRVKDFGNWHQIQYGDIYGYVKKSGTRPALEDAPKTTNDYTFQDEKVRIISDAIIYDNSTGKLIPFATLSTGLEYPVVNNSGNWYEVVLSNRIGYIHKDQVKQLFAKSTKFFKVTESDTPVYDNRQGYLKKVGTLSKEEVYPRTKDYGNWHQINFGGYFGYVAKNSTEPAGPGQIQNLNKDFDNMNETFKVLADSEVYDNSTGKLIPFANLMKGEEYPIATYFGNWYRILLADRVGYIHKDNVQLNFNKSTKYFEVTEDDTFIYDNRKGYLEKVGVLSKGQVYPRVKDYGNWHEIKFGDFYGYVAKNKTAPAGGASLKNLNTNYKNTKESVYTKTSVTVYDNTSGKLVPFAVLEKGKSYPVASLTGTWYKVLLADRVGYIHSGDVDITFSQNAKYFKAMEEGLVIYDNRSGKLVPMGVLEKGQTYLRENDFGNWHEISFGNITGFITKKGTQHGSYRDFNNHANQSLRIGTIKLNKDEAVYDNTGNKLQPFAYLDSGIEIAVSKDFGSWYEINIGGRYGYVKKDSVANYTPLVRDAVNPNQTYTYERLQSDLNQLEELYPNLIKMEVIGKSVDGRNLYAVKLGTGNTEIQINAAHHAREHMTANVIMEMIDEYAQAYYSTGFFAGYNVRDVLSKTSIWFVPMVNPDGITLVQKGHKSAKNSAYVLKLNNGSTDFSSWKANIRGVDLNRNYPSGWSIKRGGNVPAPQDYKGPKALSEPETKALYNFTLKHDFKTAVAYHSAGEILYWSFETDPDVMSQNRKLAEQLSKETGYPLVPPAVNPIGAFDDWFIDRFKRPGFTPEISPYPGPRPVPLKNYPKIWQQNRAVGLLLAEEAYLNRNKR